MSQKNKEFSTEIEVRFADIDAYGHVNNAKYFTFLETARTKIFMGNFVDFMKENLLFIVVKAECSFKLPIKLGDDLRVKLWINNIGKTSFDIDYMLENFEGRLYATAKTTMVTYDDLKKTPTLLPEEFIKMVS
ncbi:MAG: thioesterase family protein [SAR324 cluster bacterium]|nr:thioesterase family protein [SAR324 cluster bacterium]